MSRAEKIAIALDGFVSVIVGGRFATCLSSRAYLERTVPRWGWLYRLLNRISPEHCERSRDNDIRRCEDTLRYLAGAKYAAREQKLRAALWRYGDHEMFCDSTNYDLPLDKRWCSCGYADAVKDAIG